MKRSEPSSSPVTPPATTPEWSYETTVRAIETAIARIESGELELAEVFDEFAAAVQQLRQCEMFLSERQQQMDLLIETLTDETDF